MMEHCKGGDLLEQLLKEGRAMPEKRVVREVVLPTLTALAHLHAAGIIHRCARIVLLALCWGCFGARSGKWQQQRHVSSAAVAAQGHQTAVQPALLLRIER